MHTPTKSLGTEMTKKKKTKDAVEIVDRMVGSDQDLRNAVEEETVNSHVATLIYDARKRANLTQKQLGGLVGTTQTVIARLESSDYEGHSLSMLIRIAEALNNRLEINLVPRDDIKRTA